MREIAPIIAEHVQQALQPLNLEILGLAQRITELEERLRWLKPK
jgi:hypothetical protein